MRKLISGLLLIFIATSAFSQSQTLKGTLKDTSENRSLANTVISVLSKKDSVLVKFVRADKDGNFKIQGVNEGSYILMVTHPYMGDYFDNIEVKEGAPTDLGYVHLTPKSKLLSEVIVKSGSPIKIKGDTLVYTADSFKVRPGANVEELLRRLPGITVDKNGQITAMGERVTKVLVDGEEFFGTDPGIATKNIRADAVQEVQVFDKKSDQAAFTGIDDGIKDKTINLKMKKMAGYFGKVELGGGLPDKYDNSAMVNLFRNKRKVAGYGIMSNTGQTNLDWQDAQNYGGAADNMTSGVSDDGGMYIMFGGGGDDNYYGGRNGIPQNWNAGVHFSDKFNKEKTSFNSGYKYSKVIAPGLTKTFSQTFLPNTAPWSSNSTSDNRTSTNKHAINMTMEFKIDSNNTLKWTSRFNNNNAVSSVNYSSETLDEQGNFINNNTRKSKTNTDKNNVVSSLLWQHKFKKFARTLSINTDFNWNRSKSDGLLYSLTKYYKNGILNRDTTDQENIIDNINNTIGTKISYTEPLKKDFYMELTYGFTYNNSKSDRLTNIKSINGKYEEIVDSLSNFFIFNRTQNTPGISFRLNKKKHNLTVGTSVDFNQFEKKDLTRDTIVHYNFVNFIPRASYTYKIKPNESLRINYNGTTTAPSLEQMQPTRVNTDPLNVYIGNPFLKQSFRHNINAGYNFYNVLKEKNLFTNLRFTLTDNAFVQASIIDSSSGKRTYLTVNADGNYSINFYSSYGFKIKGFSWRNGIGPNININRSVEFINGIKNINNTKNYSIQLSTSTYKEDKYNVWLSANFGINDSKSSVNTEANAKYWSINLNGSGSKTFAKKYEIGSDVSLQVREKDPRFPDANSFTTWNGYILKRFFKENQFELKLQVNDILNENRGYSRNFSSYSYTETYYETLQRFWLVTATWNISKNGKPAKW